MTWQDNTVYKLQVTSEVSMVYIRMSEIGAQRRPQANNYVTCKKNKIEEQKMVEPGAAPHSSILRHVRE